MSSTAFVDLMHPSQEVTLEAMIDGVAARRDEWAASLHPVARAREVAFLQPAPMGAMLIIYRQARDTVTPATAPTQLLIEDFSRTGHRDPYAFALPVAPGKLQDVFAFAEEINTVHRAEFEAGGRRLGIGVRIFLHRPVGLDLLISYLEGRDAPGAFGRMLSSNHPFDRWHAQQIADLGGLDLSQAPQPLNRLLWDWDMEQTRER